MSQIKLNYVINLKRRQDRWNKFENNKNKTVLKDETFIKFEAFDGFDFDNEVKRFNIDDHEIFKSMKTKNISILKGELGCLLSHLLLLTNIMNNNEINDDDYVGIYEDDIFYCTNFNEKYNEFRKIDLDKMNIEFIYLGGQFNIDFDCKNTNNFNSMFEKTENVNIFRRYNYIYDNNWFRCTHSYVIKKNICQKLINLIISSYSSKYINTKRYNYNIIKKTCYKFNPIDHIYANDINQINKYDYLPHLFFSPLNYESDIQDNKLKNKIYF